MLPRENNIEALPVELILQILSSLKLADFLNFAHANKWTKAMASLNKLSIKTRLNYSQDAVIKGSYKHICDFLEKNRRLETLEASNMHSLGKKFEGDKIEKEFPTPPPSEFSVSYRPHVTPINGTTYFGNAIQVVGNASVVYRENGGFTLTVGRNQSATITQNDNTFFATNSNFIFPSQSTATDTFTKQRKRKR